MDSLPDGNNSSSTATAGVTMGTAASAPIPNTTAPTSSKLAQLIESLKLEHQFLRVPFEQYKKTSRANHRIVKKEMTAVINGLNEATDSDLSRDDAVSQLNSLVSRLQGLKRKDLVDIDVFREANRVIDALQNKDLALALAWCSDNKSSLKKSKSELKYQLRCQEFIELVRAENYFQAIKYAQKYLAQWGATHKKELQQVMATLILGRDTECATYKVFFEPKQWDHLVCQFKQEFCKLYGTALEPLLNIYLRAGLSALKTPYCYQDDCTKEDPLSQEAFRTLALPFPYSKRHRSKFVCYITKEPMDAENPPLALPNGYVYSTKALEEMTKKNNGKITCPRTGAVYNYTELVQDGLLGYLFT